MLIYIVLFKVLLALFCLLDKYLNFIFKWGNFFLKVTDFQDIIEYCDKIEDGAQP